MRAIDPSSYLKAFEAEFAGKALAGLGAVPLLQWLPISALRVDPTYQRDILKEGRRTIVQIALHFDWAKFAPVVVAALEGGFYAIIDGQHRTTAAALRGAQQVPCMVVIADQPRQAEAFAAINGTVTRLHSLAIYHARLAAGDPDAKAVQDVCDAAEVVVMRYPVQATKLARGETIAPNVLISALSRYGRTTLTAALQCVSQTADGHPGALGKPVIEALCAVLAAAPGWCEPRGLLLDTLDDFDFRAELTEARVAHHRTGEPVTALLSARITTFLTGKLGSPTVGDV